MKNYLINFQEMDWENPAPGIRQKTYVKNKYRIRLVEFSEEFVEKDWCTREHTGYVLEGIISIDFDGKIIEFKAGDGLFIPAGEENKHKGKVAKGERALLLLFEDA